MTGFGKHMILLVCLGVAAGQAQASDMLATRSAGPISGIADISLTNAGRLTGRFISSDGVGVDGAIVALSQGKSVLAKSTTDASGDYQFSGLKQGVYQITAGHQTQSVRVWNENLAPPSARSLVTTVRTDHVVRGQGGGGLGATIGIVGGITGTALGGYAISVARDAEDDAARANRQMEHMDSEMLRMDSEITSLRLVASP